jgi:hypothetical protein
MQTLGGGAYTHPPAAHEVLTSKLLDGVSIVATMRSDWSWANLARSFDLAGAVCNAVAEREFTAIALNMAAAGVGLCLAGGSRKNRNYGRKSRRMSTAVKVGTIPHK